MPWTRLTLALLLTASSVAVHARDYAYSDAHLHYVDFFQETAGMDKLLKAMASGGGKKFGVKKPAAVSIAASAGVALFEHDAEQFAVIQMNITRELCRRLRATDEMLFQLQRGMPLAPDFGPTLL